MNSFKVLIQVLISQTVVLLNGASLSHCFQITMTIIPHIGNACDVNLLS